MPSASISCSRTRKPVSGTRATCGIERSQNSARRLPTPIRRMSSGRGGTPEAPGAEMYQRITENMGEPMARDPEDLLARLREQETRLADQLERHIDADLDENWRGGEFRFNRFQG